MVKIRIGGLLVKMKMNKTRHDIECWLVRVRVIGLLI